MDEPCPGIAVGVACGIVPKPTPFEFRSAVRQTGTVTNDTSMGGSAGTVKGVDVPLGGDAGLVIGVAEDVGLAVLAGEGKGAT